MLATRHMAPRATAAEIVTCIQQLLAQAAVTLQQIEAVAVASGPGSFTGTRIGLATAKGLAEGLSLPLIMISSLALLAAKLPKARAVLDAGRGEFYAGEYEQCGQHCLWERLLTRDELLSTPLSDSSHYVVCEQIIAEDLGRAGLTVLMSSEPDAASVARFIAVRGFTPTPDWCIADANYLRRSDAELKLKASR